MSSTTSSQASSQTSSSTVRWIVVPIAGTVCVVAATALTWAPSWLEEYRLIVACAFPLSLVTFLVAYTVRRVPLPAPTPQERAEERMGTVRVALVTRKLQELQGAHDTLIAELTRLRAAPPALPAAPASSSEDRPDPSPALRAELAEVRAELDLARKSAARAEEFARETSDLRAALAAAESASVALKKRVEASQEAGVLAKVEAERLRADLDAAREQDQSARVAPLTKENGDLRRRAAELDSDVVASRERAVAAESASAALRTGFDKLRTELEEARTDASRAESRSETVSEEFSSLRTALAAAEESSRALAERAASAEGANERLRADLETARSADRSARAESLAAENDALRARVPGLEAEIVAARGRIEAAEANVARLEAAERQAGKGRAPEIAHVKARGSRLNLLDNYSPSAPEPNAEIERLRGRIEEAEEAVRAALHELGVRDAASWPATVEGVTQAVGPLTLYAMGEPSPGWDPNPDDDTLASAVVTLALQSAERQRQLERIGASITQNGRKH